VEYQIVRAGSLKKNKVKNWSIELRQDWCKGCYFCIDVCPITGIFTKDVDIGQKRFKPIIVNPIGCTGCMLCELQCPDLAITVAADETNN